VSLDPGDQLSNAEVRLAEHVGSGG